MPFGGQLVSIPMAYSFVDALSDCNNVLCSPRSSAEYICPLSLCAVGPVIMSIEEKMEADGRSIYVGNVSRV